MVRTSSVSLSLLVLAAAAASCASEQSRLMRPASVLDATPTADDALVVFVRDSNPCDDGGPFRIVDEKRRFVGEMVPSSKFAVRVAPGEHAFFVWQPDGDVPRDLYPQANQVGALQRAFEAGMTYTIDVSITNAPHGVRNTCFAYQWLALHLVAPSSPKVSEALGKARALAPDVAAGQAAVDAASRDADAHIELGMRKLAASPGSGEVSPDVFGGKLGGGRPQ